jgi:diguanylate cyclase (GGDEF)-like protein
MLNRAAAIAGIRSALDRAARSGQGVAVLFVDLNDFKSANDNHGHKVGDEVLREVADRMKAVIRDGELAARLGGDEFVIIAESVGHVEQMVRLARRIIETVSRPFEIGRLRIDIGASCGIAMALESGDEPLRLLARADLAMYKAKDSGGSSIEVFDGELQAQLLNREDIQQALTTALAEPDGGGLMLYYQPVVEATTGRPVSTEALIRWNRPGHGLIMPDDFIPIAEATPLIITLDCWVLSRAAEQLATWAADPDLCNLKVAVNISGRHLLSKTLPEHIRAVCDQTNIDPHRLTIEITETVLLTDLAVASAELDAVRALGIKVAIDDFGTGYTSLAHLQLLPIDTIKIDRSFILQLHERRGESLVRMVTDLGHSMGVTIIAEGVETPEELFALQALGADQIQGYLFSKPLPSADLHGWVHDHVARA